MSESPNYIVLLDCISIWDIKVAGTIEEACEIAEIHRKGRAHRSRDAWVYTLHAVQWIDEELEAMR